MSQWLDWSAFGFLALLTLLDGLRRVPAGALVLRKVVGGQWAVVAIDEGYRLVSWWPPLSTTIVIPQPGRPAGGDALSARLASVRQPVMLLKFFGMLSLVTLVVVVPLGMRWWGGAGFLLSLLVVLLLSWLVTGHCYFSSRVLGLGTRQRILFALPRMNPFAAPAAGEALLERACEGADPIAVARELMEEAEFERWIRPMAYDVTQGFEVEGGKELLRVMKRRDLTRIVSAPPPGGTATGPWCPRCGAEFGSISTSCSGCEVPLNR